MASWSAAMRHELGSTQRRVLQLSAMIRQRLGELDPEVAEAFELLEENAGRGQCIAETLSEYTLLPEHDPEARFDAAAVVREVVDRLGAQPGHEDVPAIDVSVEPATDSTTGSLQVIGQPELLRAALNELLDNALVHGAAPIEVVLTREGETLRVAVHSAGPLVDGAFLTRMRRPMQRGPNAAPRTAGLGLTIAQRATRSLGGRVTLKSRKGGGLVASLLLPLRA